MNNRVHGSIEYGVKSVEKVDNVDGTVRRREGSEPIHAAKHDGDVSVPKTRDAPFTTEVIRYWRWKNRIN